MGPNTLIETKCVGQTFRFSLTIFLLDGESVARMPGGFHSAIRAGPGNLNRTISGEFLLTA
jgi:hypothetical protein